MKVIRCFCSAVIFVIAYSSCTKFQLDETEKDVQVIEKILEDLREVQPPMLPSDDSPKPYLASSDMPVSLDLFVV